MDENSFPTPFLHPGHSLTGDFRHHAGLPSDALAHKRDVLVYLPPGYGADSHRRYPVLYLHDGQNVFDRATSYAGVEWGVDETAERLIEAGEIEPLIIVGIHNTGDHRVDEYTPTVDPRVKKGGKADAYGHFLLHELKPFIDRHYRTRRDAEHTGLGGSSLGGLVSLYLGMKHPEVFGKLLVMSPSVWWDGGVILRRAESLAARLPLRIWLDIGTREGKFTPAHVRTLRDILISKGWRSNDDLKYLEVKGGLHTESDWARRVEPSLKFLFPA
jgi:enterochelin esterase-like enzyme